MTCQEALHALARTVAKAQPAQAGDSGGQASAEDRADCVLTLPPVLGITTSAWALRRVFAGRTDQGAPSGTVQR